MSRLADFDKGLLTHSELKAINPKIKLSTKGTQKWGKDGNFRDLAARIESNAPVITFRTAQRIETLAKLHAPKPPAMAWWYPNNPKVGFIPPYRQYIRTGELVASIYKTKDSNGWTVGVGAPYAKFVEYGTSKMPANPFWQTALKHGRFTMKEQVKGWLKK